MADGSKIKLTVKQIEMKRFLYILALTVAVLTGCDKENKPASLSDRLCCEWKLTSPDAAVYVSFGTDKTFEEYQRLNGESYELRRGQWTLSGNILSGKYNDGEDWAYAYQVTIDDKTLTLSAQEDRAIENVYVKCEIPDIIKETCNVVVKSGTF